MRLLIIRHGESEADILKVHEGRADFSLTELGRKQAKAMACWVKENYKVDKIYSSTLKRAKETAAILESEIAVAPIFMEELREFNNGLIAGLSREEAEKRYPKPKFLPMHKAVYEMESMLAFRQRAEYALSKLLWENPKDETIAVISHGGMINQLYQCFLRLPVESDIRFATGDTGIHCWHFGDDGRYIIFSNYTGHTLSLN